MRNSDAGNRSRFLDKLIYLSPGTRCERNALKEQRLYSKGCEMTGRLPSSVVCPHNTYPSCVGVPAESVRALCHRALCRTFSHVFLREQSVLSAPFFFFLFGGLPKKPFFSHTKKVVAVLLVVFRVLWGSEHREKKRRLGFLDWMVARLSSFSKSMNIFNFLIIDLNTRLF